jgi:hypothetical protein
LVPDARQGETSNEYVDVFGKKPLAQSDPRRTQSVRFGHRVLAPADVVTERGSIRCSRVAIESAI